MLLLFDTEIQSFGGVDGNCLHVWVGKWHKTLTYHSCFVYQYHSCDYVYLFMYGFVKVPRQPNHQHAWNLSSISTGLIAISNEIKHNVMLMTVDHLATV